MSHLGPYRINQIQLFPIWFRFLGDSCDFLLTSHCLHFERGSHILPLHFAEGSQITPVYAAVNGVNDIYMHLYAAFCRGGN
jgi:hypothetical protein